MNKKEKEERKQFHAMTTRCTERYNENPKKKKEIETGVLDILFITAIATLAGLGAFYLYCHIFNMGVKISFVASNIIAAIFGIGLMIYQMEHIELMRIKYKGDKHGKKRERRRN